MNPNNPSMKENQVTTECNHDIESAFLDDIIYNENNNEKSVDLQFTCAECNKPFGLAYWKNKEKN